MTDIPSLNMQIQNANTYTEGSQLIATTGLVKRVWEWTDDGFSSRLLSVEGTEQQWTGVSDKCDWELPENMPMSSAKLLNLSAQIQDDDGFTSKHIAVVADIEYPDAKIMVRWTVWVYPDAPGLRTQLAAKRLSPMEDETTGPAIQGGPIPARVDQIPYQQTDMHRRFIGYYNETQQRNDTHQNILKEEVVSHPLGYKEWCSWASAACVENETSGFALVKESHKCVNQGGYDGGGFVCDVATGLSCTGWGLRRKDITDQFKACWATWTIAWSGATLAREMACKSFDRIRYPLDPERDIYIQANTWGSTDNGQDARSAATEPSVLEEISTCKEIGIEVLQIDDGWQVPPGNVTWDPGDHGWHPHPQSYPQGWEPVRKAAEQNNIKLGLWAAAEPVGLDELKSNYTDGGFRQFKLDFANLRTRESIDALMEKVRQFILWTGHSVRVNWDVTENPARYGYFFAREYGCIYLENRKPQKPLSVIYRPHTVLRDIWQVSKYLNVHRFQSSIQNVDLVDAAHSDAHLHSHSYATAIGLVGIPLFFQETKYYSKEARAEIRKLLDVYKAHRAEMFSAIVHPVGQKPDNASWTGFQWHLPEKQTGYLLVFRETCNTQDSFDMPLAWLPSKEISLTDLVTGNNVRATTSPEGALPLQIHKAPGFTFLRYDVAQG